MKTKLRTLGAIPLLSLLASCAAAPEPLPPEPAPPEPPPQKVATRGPGLKPRPELAPVALFDEKTGHLIVDLDGATEESIVRSFFVLYPEASTAENATAMSTPPVPLSLAPKLLWNGEIVCFYAIFELSGVKPPFVATLRDYIALGKTQGEILFFPVRPGEMRHFVIIGAAAPFIPKREPRAKADVELQPRRGGGEGGPQKPPAEPDRVPVQAGDARVTSL